MSYPPLNAWGGPPPQQTPPPQHQGGWGAPASGWGGQPAHPQPAQAYPGAAAPAPYGAAPAYGAPSAPTAYGAAPQQPAYPSAYPAAPHGAAPPSGYPYAAGGAPHQQHHQQQQQHHHHQRPPAAAAGGGRQVAVIDARYCFPQPLDLILKENITMGSYGSDNFQVLDKSGRCYFMLQASHFSMSEKRVLLDATGQPVAGMAKKLLTMKPTWLLYRGGGFSEGARVAEVKSHFGLSPSVSVYLNDGDRESDFKIRGNFRAKKFAITQKLPGGGERPVAEFKKESRFSSAAAFLQAAVTAADNYHVHIEPGVDAAFVVALALLIDEMFHDQAQ